MAEVASAYVSLIPSMRGSEGTITKETDRVARAAGKRFGGTFSGSLKSVIGGALAGLGVTKLLGDALGEAREAQKVGALTTQVIKSTGGAANVSAKQVGDLATSISNKVGVDDEAIQSGENLLLTFKNIRNEAGRGNKIFDQATHATVDLAAALAAASGGQLNFRSASTLVGKALNDPVKGLTALQRVGVTFTDQQKKQIEALVKSGDAMGAQKIILRELRSEFGGAAKAQATDADKAQVAFKNLEEQIGTALLPVVDDLARKFTKDVVPAISDFVTEMQDGTGTGGQVVDVLSDLVDVGKGVLDLFDSLPGPVKKFGIEIAIGALAVGKMNTALGGSKFGAFVTDLQGAETRAARTSRALQGLGGVLRNVAGAGGMLLLADGAGKAGTKMGTLESAAGGALSGAALGAFAGPVGAGIGAAIGGLAGAAFSLSRNTQSAADAARESLGDWKAYKDTLDDVSGATTTATRKFALQRLQQSGVLKNTQAIGIADRQVVNAVVNGGKARERVIASLEAERKGLKANIAAKEQQLAVDVAAAGRTDGLSEKQIIAAQDRADATRSELDALKDRAKERNKDIDATEKELGAVDKSVKAKQHEIAVTTDLTGKLKGIPKRVATQIKAEGIVPTTKGIIQLAEKYNLTPKQVKTAIAATGVPFTEGQVSHIIKTVEKYGNLHPRARIDADTSAADAKIRSLISRIAHISGNVHITATTNANVAEAGLRAAGGPVLAGHPYIVGERRPELFVPSQNGRIVPRVPTVGASSVDSEQAFYRGMSRALAANQVVIMSKSNLDELNLLVGAM